MQRACDVGMNQTFDLEALQRHARKPMRCNRYGGKYGVGQDGASAACNGPDPSPVRAERALPAPARNVLAVGYGRIGVLGPGKHALPRQCPCRWLWADLSL